MSFFIKKLWTANLKTKLISFMEQGGGKEEEKGRSFQMHKYTFHFQNVKGFITYTGTKDWVKEFAIPLCLPSKGVRMSTAVMLSLVIELWLLLAQTTEGQ